MIHITFNNISNNELLIDKFIDKIRLSDNLEELIHQRYTALGEWLDNSSIKQYKPIIYPQGSVRTGTVIKPLKNGAYDVDLVCQLQLDLTSISTYKLKEMVGEEIKSYMQLHNFKEEIINARKCWTIEYSDEVSFHIDILPAIKKEPHNPLSTDIFITNKDLYGFKNISVNEEQISDIWEDSNPKGFANWLKEKELNTFLKIKKLQKKLEPIPEHNNVITPLRKSIMLLKRHRDIFFQHEKQEFRTASVIITTLAGNFYEHNPLDSTEDTLKWIISQLSTYTPSIDNNLYFLQSPSSSENFLDKWNQDKNYKKHFENWVKKLSEDTSDIKFFLNSCQDTDELTNDELVNFLLNQKHVVTKFETEINHLITCKIDFAKDLSYKSKNSNSKLFYNKDPVNKGTELEFIMDTNLLNNDSFIVYWRVINTGKEAFNSKNLRGDLFWNTNLKQKSRVETARFLGIHSIEAFIVQNQKIVAQSLPFIIKIK